MDYQLLQVVVCLLLLVVEHPLLQAVACLLLQVAACPQHQVVGYLRHQAVDYQQHLAEVYLRLRVVDYLLLVVGGFQPQLEVVCLQPPVQIHTEVIFHHGLYLLKN